MSFVTRRPSPHGELKGGAFADGRAGPASTDGDERLGTVQAVLAAGRPDPGRRCRPFGLACGRELSRVGHRKLVDRRRDDVE
jgi:hypothetical protein